MAIQRFNQHIHSRRSVSAFPISAGVILCILVFTVLPHPADGQAARPSPRDAADSSDTSAAIIQTSEEANTLLARAEEGIQRQDWKLTVDALQRIIELPGEHLLTSDRQIYESARNYAHRRIASLPPAGLEAYRTIHDGEAAALLNQARDRHDFDLLRTIANKYLLSRYGDDAAVTLADWLIDEDRVSEAAAYLRQVSEIYPDSDLPSWVIPARLAVCAAAMGQSRQATEILDRLTQLPTSEPLTRRIEMIRAFIAADSSTPGTAQNPDGWPIAMGGPDRRGMMPSVTPAFPRRTIWSTPLPMRNDEVENEDLSRYGLSQHLPPTRHAVTDGQTLLVKGEMDLIALDSASLSVRWSTRDLPEEIHPPRMAYMQTAESLRPDAAKQLENQPVVWRMLYDHVGAGVSLAYGMALTLEWNTDPPSPGIVAAPAQRAGRANFGDGVTNMEANRVVAYSLVDGQRLWESAGLSEENEGTNAEVGDGQFLAAPMPVENILLVPCRIETDLYVLLLDPQTGKRVHKIYICGFGGRTFSALSCLEPCLANGVVFVQTGAGAIAAIDTADWSIRWIARYQRKPEGEAGGWLPTPLIAVADVILAAPTDADQLICFDSMTGRSRWRIPREDFRYLLGANDRHAWLAGKRVRMIEMEDGHTLWQADAAEPTGRGAVAGKRIYLPTTDGLMAYEADTGKPIVLEQPEMLRPLGNLLAWDRALYSVSSLEVSKYPDLENGYAEAVAAHRTNPADVSRALRLAWLEWSQDRPAEALLVLRGLPDTLEQQDERQYRIVNQLQVRLLLESAAVNGTTPAQARAYLAEATRIAIRTEDRNRSILALADHERDEQEWSAACRHYLSLVLSPLGDELMEAELDLQRRVRLTAALHIAELAVRLNPTERDAFDRQLREWEQKAVDQHDEQALRWLVESTPLGEVACRAALQLGIWMSQEQRNESAEQLYQYILRHASTSALAAEATARLARLYLEPDELHLPVSASALLDKLEHEYAGESLPANILDPAGKDQGREEHKPIGVPQVVAALRASIDEQILTFHRAAAEPLHLTAPTQTFTMKSFANACPLVVGGPRPEALTDKMLMLVEGKRLEARQAGDGTLLWPADLKLLGDPAIEPRLEVTGQEMFVNNRRVYQARGVLEGQTLIVNTGYGLHAVGLVTGRRLWARPFDPPFVAAQSRDPSGYDSWLWANEGYVASVDAQGRLEVAPADRGDAVLWRCRRPMRDWYAVRCRGEHVVAVDRNLQTADIFRLADGRYLGECRFHQDRDPRLWTNLSLFDNAICGPVSQYDVAAFEMAVPGIERWRTTMPGPLSQIFKPNADLLAVADRTGFLRIIDPANGRTVLETTVAACRNGVTDGVIIDRVLYVYGYQQREVNPARFENQRWAITAIRLDDGSMIWQRSALPAATYLSPEILSLSNNAIPVAAFLPKSAGQDILLQELQQQFPRIPVADYAGLVEVRLVDKANGQDLGPKALISLQGRPGSLLPILDVQAWPDHLSIMVGTLRIQLPLKSNNATQPPG